ncbi:MAG: UDP-3-O-(3-hydroxymyristoyl)glucosamine N-acyltransferase [Candidatus Krumholzibacteriota bacterium]|nr:UDP-3-O-(3-hydroxymyristoyl)glucosamine N-acyltransferase [Candidatus Krumholzibacteriota bacterium]
MAEYILEELARVVGGEVEGDPTVRITGVAGIKEAGKGQITFLANSKYESYLASTKASALIAAGNGNFKGPVITVDNPYLAFLKVVTLFSQSPMERYPRGIHGTAVISGSASIGSDVSIGAYVVIGDNAVIGDRSTILPLTVVSGDVRIGEDCLLYAHVIIRENCEIGDRVIIHSGTVIGSDGFGYAKQGCEHHKIPQIGIVRIEDDVEIGANTTVDRATTGVTLIQSGSKIDNLVQIAHNVVIGNNSVLAAQVGVSGSTELEKNVVLAGQAGLVGHIKIGEGAMVGAQGGVTKSIPPGTTVSGYPAREHSFARKIYAASTRLPDLLKNFRDLQKRVEALEKGSDIDPQSKDD